MDSDEESQAGMDLVAAFKARGGRSRGNTSHVPRNSSRPAPPTNSSRNRVTAPWRAHPITKKVVQVRVPPVRNPERYKMWIPNETVDTVIEEYERRGRLLYRVKLTNGTIKEISFEELLETDDGPIALEVYQNQEEYQFVSERSTEESDQREMDLRKSRRQVKRRGFVDITKVGLSSDEDELASNTGTVRQTRLRRGAASQHTSNGRRSRRSAVEPSSEESSEESDDEPVPRRGRKRKAANQQPVRRSSRAKSTPKYDQAEVDDGDEQDTEDESSEGDILRSDVLHNQRKRKRGRPSTKCVEEQISKPAVRHSERATRAQKNMREAGEEDIYRRDSDGEKPSAAPKVVGVKEVFRTLPRSDPFRSRHIEGCETCGGGPNIAPLVYCQGCCLAYHKNCLGVRATREHLVTKIGDEDFVLQCRRCINVARKRDPTVPDLSKCQDCNLTAPSCHPFRARKTTQQEQKDREENFGQDPIIYVPAELINNADNVLFRCTKCSRGFHYHHLPPLSPYSMDIVRDDHETADERFQEYSKHWLCKDCDENKSRKVGGLIAWRPSDAEAYQANPQPCEILNEDEKQYLIKWNKESYFRASWHSGSWTWGVTAPAMRKAFFKRGQPPTMRTDEAIPEEYLRIDIVLDVKFTSVVKIRSEEIDKARIKEVDTALIKYKGLGYEDAVWEKVPTPEDGDRWLDFVTAYNDWVAGRYIKVPKQGPLKSRLEKARGTPFSKLEKTKQPENLVGGELMKYQIDGLNWIYYQWYSGNNGILADEMGLGKTIQVIGFMATLVEEHNCCPFLVVVPNSTCANWRREIKQWVPGLRVVTYFGSATARDMAYRYEMYLEGSKDLRCHIVVTSYEAAADESCRKVFRGVNWAGLIVDEGQRLKNDKSQLYASLSAIKTPFRLLMTGTPLQNNARELFNLLQFLDDTINAAELEERYGELTAEKIKELHDKIRPYILRRTKAQVLTFLPPLGQIIVPLSMSVLQKQLYKSILAKNPELLKALFSTNKSLKPQERANLSNILMQLRKCLCHPFVYSQEIEERTDTATISHRNLVEASPKLELLELLLPKLREAGHRVLIFSQFLDMLNIMEDFLESLEMPYQRLDGTIGSLEKQKRIDAFNAPDSPLFAFLLSTRAGGVGINLATADTVIILDPDFNPHQDVQAISRAHRIGQKKKVLCFQLMTRASVEEKIISIGRKKMALDHVVVEQLGEDDLDDKDFESILKYGAAELFKDDSVEHDIRYDDNSIAKLLDRSALEDTKTASDNTAESQFSFARVWENDQGTLKDSLDAPEEEVAPDPGVWDKILKERQAAAAAEALARADALGRGKRARMAVDYKLNEDDGIPSTKESKGDKETRPASPAAPAAAKEVAPCRRRKKEEDSDTDFQADESDEDESENEPTPMDVDMEASALGEPRRAPDRPSMYDRNDSRKKVKAASTRRAPSGPVAKDQAPIRHTSQNVVSQPLVSVHDEALIGSGPVAPIAIVASDPSAVKPFARAQLPVRSPFEPDYQFSNRLCVACREMHPRGACPLKIAGVEHCGLCGLAHFGVARTCPHIHSETQVREMLAALKQSAEPRELVELAKKYLVGVKGNIVHKKKKDREKAEREKEMALAAAAGVPTSTAYQQPYHPHAPPHQNYCPNTTKSPYGPPSAYAAGVNGVQRGAPPAPAMQRQPMQQLQDGNRGGAIEDHVVEGALRGFLGH